MRLNKFLASCGIASRRKCDILIQNGQVSVNGIVCTNMGTQINEKKDKVTVDGAPCSFQNEKVYIKLNKPKGVVCSSSDDKGRKTVLDIVKVPNARIFNVGRLDYDTEGLLLLTNDGDFAQLITHPSFEIEKTYVANIEGTVKESELAVMRAGVVIEGDRLPPCKIKQVASLKENETRLEITINEGKNRQIRKMFEAIGRRVLFLKRITIGPISLGGLSRGEFKALTQEEIASIIRMSK
ncbi:MAG: pseudouridine synthase [Clostridia bacterium]